MPAASPTPRTARSGRSAATARWTSRNRSARSRSPAREKLDNLIFVINCNLQRLDGPVRGNGKIIQELEGDFRGAGWNVIKVHLGLGLGRAARQDKDGMLLQLMEEMRRRRVPGLQGQGRRLRAQALLRQVSRDCWSMVADMTRRRHLEPEPRRPRSAQGLRGLRGRGRSTRASRR